MNRPEATLFMLMSLDGKISTGDTEVMDADKDFPKVSGLEEGLQQYYDIEKTTDVYSFNSGRVFAKIGLNEKKIFINIVPAFFVIVDNKPHLTVGGLEHLLSKTKGVILITTNKQHPAFDLEDTQENLEILFYEGEIDFVDAFAKLKNGHGVDKMTIQSGGTLNAKLFRENLVDHVSVVVAPVVIGGKDTATLVDGESLHSEKDLADIKSLKLKSCEELKSSYLHLKYDVIY